MASLVVVTGPNPGKRYELGQSCVLGRSFNSDVYVGDLNVSRRHAQIETSDRGHVLEDLGSGNGTYVNDARIAHPHRLQPGDIVRVGGSSFRFEDERSRQRWSEDVLTVIADAAIIEAEHKRPCDGDTEPVKPVPHTLTPARAEKALEAMVAVADAIATELDLGRLLDKILDCLFEVFPQAERGFVLLTNPATGELIPEATKQRSSFSSGLQFSRTVFNQVMAGGTGVIRGGATPPAQPREVARGPDGRYITSENNLFALDEGRQQGEPKMGAPLICRGECLGTLQLEAEPGSRAFFFSEDLGLLAAIARQAAVAIANSRAGQSLLAQQRLQDDLRLARQIQRSFLPQHLPQIAHLQLATHYQPALHVGGDFYDILELGPERVAMMVGDISGKGVSAALLMAKLTTDIRILSRSRLGPGELLTQANVALAASGQDAIFATVVYVLLDLAAGTLTVANAGHQPPLVVSRRFEGLGELDDATGVALGVMPDMVYAEKVYELAAGDVILLYTDGINEAMNKHHQEYSMDRLRTAMSTGPVEPGAVVQRVLSDVHRFVGSAAQSDDQTLVAFGVA
jgi:phosphoserine phosphatase RsbU/P